MRYKGVLILALFIVISFSPFSVQALFCTPEQIKIGTIDSVMEKDHSSSEHRFVVLKDVRTFDKPEKPEDVSAYQSKVISYAADPKNLKELDTAQFAASGPVTIAINESVLASITITPGDIFLSGPPSWDTCNYATYSVYSPKGELRYLINSGGYAQYVYKGFTLTPLPDEQLACQETRETICTFSVKFKINEGVQALKPGESTEVAGLGKLSLFKSTYYKDKNEELGKTDWSGGRRTNFVVSLDQTKAVSPTSDPENKNLSYVGVTLLTAIVAVLATLLFKRSSLAHRK